MRSLYRKASTAAPYMVAAILGVFFIAVLFGADVSAVSTSDNIRDGVQDVSTGNTANTPLTSIIRIVVNALLFLVGVVAVIMLIIGGFRYVASQGDSGATASAKNTILYAVIGLIVAIAAFAIVNFILNQFS